MLDQQIPTIGRVEKHDYKQLHLHQNDLHKTIPKVKKESVVDSDLPNTQSG